MESINKVFVYGTLKVGGYFAGQFDKLRVKSEPKVVNGVMFSVYNRYAGVRFDQEGDVIGEVHTFKQKDIKKVIETMDRIEGYYKKNPDSSFYKRVKIIMGGEDVYAYQINVPCNKFERIESGEWKI